MISKEALIIFGFFIELSFRCHTIPYYWEPGHMRLVMVSPGKRHRGYMLWYLTIVLFCWAPFLLLSYKFLEDCVSPPKEVGTSPLNFLSVYFYNCCSLFFASCVHFVVLGHTKEIETFVNQLIRLDKRLQVKLLTHEEGNVGPISTKHETVPLHVVFKVMAWLSYLSAIPAALDVMNPHNIVYKYIVAWMFGPQPSLFAVIPAMLFCAPMIINMINILVFVVAIEFIYISSTHFWVKKLLQEATNLGHDSFSRARQLGRLNRLCRIYREMQVMNARFNSFARAVIMPFQQFTFSTLYVVSFTFVIKVLQHTDEIPVAMIGEYMAMPMVVVIVVFVQVLFFRPSEQIQFQSKAFVTGAYLKGQAVRSKYLRKLLKSFWFLTIDVGDYFHIRRGAFLVFVAAGLTYGIQTILV